MYKTKQALITDVQRELSQSAGPGVQMYSQDMIDGKLEQAFDHCVYGETFWPQFRKRELRVIDGVTGQVTVPLTFINQWDDIQHVFRRGSRRPLPQLPPGQNTFDITGTVAKFIEASGDANLFRVYPITAIDEVEVVGRSRRTTVHGMADIMQFDHMALVHFAAWSYFIDDETNPAAAAKHEGLYNTRMKVLEDKAQSHTIMLDPQAGDIPDRWY